MKCETCKDGGWVCEAHPDRAWGVPGGCECPGPGMPCHCEIGAENEPPSSPPAP